MTALFSSFVLVPQQPVVDGLAKAGALFCVILPILAAWLLLGSGLARLRATPTGHRALNLIFAAALVVSVVWHLCSEGGATTPVRLQCQSVGQAHLNPQQRVR